MTKKALVLAGGNVKGAFQAGAVGRLLASGWRPDLITGISVGALNAGLLAALAGAQDRAGLGVNWPSVGRSLALFWKNSVRSPAQFVETRSLLSMALRLVTNRWEGVLSLNGLRSTVVANLLPSDLGHCPVPVWVGAVGLRVGEVHYENLNVSVSPVDWVMASSSEPILMAPVQMLGDSYVDGGTREIAPLRQAIQLGADEIVVIATSPLVMESPGADWNAGSLVGQVSRTIDLMTHEILVNDLRRADEVNVLVARGIAKPGQRYVNVAAILPAFRLDVSSVTKFTPADIQKMLDLGDSAAAAANVLAGRVG